MRFYFLCRTSFAYLKYPSGQSGVVLIVLPPEEVPHAEVLNEEGCDPRCHLDLLDLFWLGNLALGDSVSITMTTTTPTTATTASPLLSWKTKPTPAQMRATG